jgi:hypothetical protein
MLLAQSIFGSIVVYVVALFCFKQEGVALFPELQKFLLGF